MIPTVIDASVGVEIVCRSRRGHALKNLIPIGTEAWVPEHFYPEVLGALRRQWLIEQLLTEAQVGQAIERLSAWPLHRASTAPMISAVWSYRHNLTPADAFYVVLADRLGADLLTDDHRLANAPTLPRHLQVRTLPR